jgi:ABC-type phosphate transport system substrate-binding protein
MKRFWLLVLMLVLLVSPAYARSVTTQNVTLAGDADILVASTGTVYTDYFMIGDGEYFNVSYYIYSALGVADVTIQLEESPVVPTTQNVSNANYTIPVNMADIVTALTTESTWYHKALSPVPLTYGRFKITGIGSNQTDTIVNIKFSKQIGADYDRRIPR